MKPPVNDWLLDASAVLTLLKRETGAESVEQALLTGASISSVNLSEVLGKLFDTGIDIVDATRAIEGLGLTVVDFEYPHALLCAEMRASTRQLGLSFADRACLATGKLMKAIVLTADRAWLALDIGVEVRGVR